MKELSLNYGSQKHLLTVPEFTDLLQCTDKKTTMDETTFKMMIRDDFSSLKISGKVAIIVADKTRLADYPLYLPVLTQCLLEHGVNKTDIRFYIAYGTHKRQTDVESENAYGSTFREYPFIHHDCDKQEQFQTLGKTSRTTEIIIRKDILEADFTISFGAVTHHYFAGFGGGRKLIFPGLGERKAIMDNHKLYVDFENACLQKNCQAGYLKNNPLAEDLAEYEDAFSVDFSIHALLNSKGSVVDITSGTDREAFLKACKRHHQTYSIQAKTYPTVIASAGGFPKDINFIQSHKAIHNAAEFVEDGGNLYILAECRDGIASTSFMEWFQKGKTTALKELSKHYKGNAGTALAMMAKTSRINIYLVSQLNDTLYAQMNIHKTTLKDIQDTVNNNKQAIAVIKNASILIANKSSFSFDI